MFGCWGVYKESLGDFIVDLEEHNAELFDYLDHNTLVNEPLTERLGAFADMSELLGTAVKGIKDQLSQTSWVGQSSIKSPNDSLYTLLFNSCGNV